MGLDTVELVVAFEKYFQIDIPNRVAENIFTVADAAAIITHLKNLPSGPSRSDAYQQLLARLLICLRPRFSAAMEITLLTEVELLGNNQEQAQTIARCLHLTMPSLPQASLLPSFTGWLQRLFEASKAAPATPPLSFNWARTTVADLTEWLLAHNYQKLLPQPTTLYDVQRTVVGITSDCCGIPVPEVQLTDRFTYDLGLD
jgi:hypothetical protein